MTRRWSADDVPTAFVAAFLLFIAVAFALWPIARTDTDLWYHLAAGRFMAATGHIPADSSYISFLHPPRPFVDYYWLFQKTVYAAFARGGYTSLVLFRAALIAAFAGTTAFLASGGRKPRAWSAFLFAATIVSLLPRFEALRPHLVEYLAVAFTLVVLDLRPAWAPALPFVAVLWGNFHGISYPVLLWICGSFVAERLLRRAPAAFDDRAFGLSAVSMAAVFATPFGGGLLSVPFGLTSRAQNQIVELKPIAPLDLLSVDVTLGGLSPMGAQKLLLALAVLALLAALARKKARPAHLLLFAGGVALLSRGQRFFVELILFSLPLLRENPPFDAPEPRAPIVGWVAGLALIASAFVPFSRRLAHRPAYPFTMARLPVGVAEFLKREGGGGKLLNYSDTGGYWEWELLPDYRIVMDMQTPFLFTEDDLFLAFEAYTDPETLRYYVDTYRPEFIETPARFEGFRRVVGKFPDYAPVFADGESILYASAGLRPELVRRWRMPVDPFDFGSRDPEKTTDPAGFDGCRPRFVARMLAVAPHAFTARVVGAQTCIARGRPEEGEREARALIADYPEAGLGYWLLGSALEKRREDAAALDAYRRGLDRGGDDASLHLRLAKVYDRLGRPDDARRERELGAPGAPNFPSPGSEKAAPPQP